MAKFCSICERGPRIVNSRSKSNIATRRRKMLNLQTRTVDGRKALVCASCIKTLKRAEAPAR